jgi:hypothetical protein
MLSMALHLRGQDLSLRDIGSSRVIIAISQPTHA